MLMSDIKIFFDRLFLPLPKAAMNEPFKLLAFSRVSPGLLTITDTVTHCYLFHQMY